MSSVGSSSLPSRPPAEWAHLELAVRRLLDEHQELQRRAHLAEGRARELETALKEMAGGQLDPIALAKRVDALEAENRDLKNRLDEARETVQRIIARIEFMEEER